MSNLKIEHFTSARFDKEQGYGFLFNYWDNERIIWDYKAGVDRDIERLVTPFLKLINHAMNEKDFENAYLIPVPSSKRFDDPNFNKEPSTNPYDPSKNRDNRNTIFCQKLSTHNSHLSCKNILKRKKEKKSKERKDAEWHKKSFKTLTPDIRLKKEFLFIVVDDVRTHGGSTEGVVKFLKQHFKKATIIVLCIAQA